MSSTLNAIAGSTLNTLRNISVQNKAAETALVTGEKSLEDVSPNAAAQAQSAKNTIAFAKSTAVRSVQATSATQLIIGAIHEGIQILTEAIGTAASEVNDLNPTAIKVHTNTVFQSQMRAFDELMSRIQWNGDYILNSSTTELQFQLGGKSDDLLKITTPNLTASDLGLGGLDITSTTNAQDAEIAIKDALVTLYDELSAISGKKNDIESIIERNALDVSKLSEKISNLIDTDIPEALASAKQHEAHIDIIYARLTKILETLKRDVELFRAK